MSKVALSIGFGAATLAWLIWPRHKSSIQIPPYKLGKWRDMVPFSVYARTKLLYMLHWDVLKFFVLETSSSGSDILDKRDITGDSPYNFTEVDPGQVWVVTYCYQVEKSLCSLAINVPLFVSEADLLEGASPERKEILLKDLERSRRCAAIDPTEGHKGQYFKEGLFIETRMVVVKLVTGGLLVYSPVKIDDEVKGWLKTLPGGGVIKAIISPSATHHFWMRSAQEAFPSALVVAGDSAGVKLAKDGVRVDANYSTPPGKSVLRTLISGSLCAVVCEGDPNQELVLFHLGSNTAMCCDLLHTKFDLDRGKARSDGGVLTEHDLAMRSHPARWAGRLFRAIWLDRSPNGLLPVYRYRLLDVHSFCPGGPPADESTAERFRKDVLLVLKEGQAVKAKRLVSCHLDEPIPWTQADKLIRASWDFLKL